MYPIMNKAHSHEARVIAKTKLNFGHDLGVFNVSPGTGKIYYMVLGRSGLKMFLGC